MTQFGTMAANECPGAAVTARGVADPEEVDVTDLTAVPAGTTPYPLRKPCLCSAETGYIREQSGQQVVYCTLCHRYQYCAPKAETGLPQRSVRNRPELKPSKRARIIDRDNGACVGCHRADVILHVGHLLSVEDGRRLGASEDEIWSDENLAAMCEECNLGFGKHTVSLRLVYRILQARMARST
jgi:5-methylcytosine-specific restriction endonuclease McrA